MALSWPTPQDILARLPLDSFEADDAKYLPEADVTRYIEVWKHELAQGSGSEAPISALAVSVVERGVTADSLEQYYVAQGQDIPRSVESMRRHAYRLLAQYAEETDIPGEISEEPVESEEGDYALNFTDEPLWTHDESRDYGGISGGLEMGRWPVG